MSARFSHGAHPAPSPCSMFKTRRPPKPSGRRRADDSDGSGENAGSATQDKAHLEKLEEVREIQRISKTQRGVLPTPPTKKKEKVESDEEEDDQWGLLDSSFATQSGQQKSDPHLEAFLNERLYARKADEEQKPKTREEKLYEIPTELHVNDFTEGKAEEMSWVAGLAEVPLGVEYKIQNIEATEEAKKKFLHGENNMQKGAVLEPDAVTRKAFGSRFLHVGDRADTKSATDDAVLERFRKRMRK